MHQRQRNRGKLILTMSVCLVALTACPWDDQEEENQSQQAAAPAPATPQGYYDIQEPPKPPEPKVVTVVKEAPPPPLPKPPPPPPPPPPGPTMEQIKASQLADDSDERLRLRNQVGPAFDGLEDVSKNRDPKKWRTTHPDFTGLGAPNLVSSFPVNRDFIKTEMQGISCVLVTPIITEIPGYVLIMLDEDVYDPSRTYKLLEKHDLIKGTYATTTDANATRVPVDLFRLERLRDGATFYTSPDNPFGYLMDAMGRTGLPPSKIHTRNWEKIKSSTYIAGLAAAPSLLLGLSGIDNPSIAQAAASWSEQLASVGAEHLKATVDLKQILEVSAGERCHIQFTRDFYLRRPEPLKEAKK